MKWSLIALAFALAPVAAGEAADAEAALGARQFERAGCGLCHRVGGVGGVAGPALDGVGRRRPDREWYRRFLRNPASLIPNAPMPPFEHLTDGEIDAIVSYLVTLR